TTRFAAGSIRETLGPPVSATQTAPGETAIPSGCLPTGIVATTRFVRGSIRETVLSEGCEIQTAPLPAAASLQACGNVGHGLLGLTLIRAMTVLRFGSIRSSVDALSLIAQTAPSPTANPPDPCGMRMLATALPPLGTPSPPATPPARYTAPSPTAQTIDPLARIARLTRFMRSSRSPPACQRIVQWRSATANTSDDLFSEVPRRVTPPDQRASTTRATASLRVRASSFSRMFSTFFRTV